MIKVIISNAVFVLFHMSVYHIPLSIEGLKEMYRLKKMLRKIEKERELLRKLEGEMG